MSKIIEGHFKTLESYVPIVARVHGASHPEFYEVQELFNIINKKVKELGFEKVDIKEELAKLREVTNYYKVPNDVCESYEAVYKMLAEVDEVYSM